MTKTYDLVVVGTGTAAHGVATTVRGAGWSVAAQKGPPLMPVSIHDGDVVADLHEKVDGRNAYLLLLDLALGRQPEPCQPGRGRHAFAVSHVLRRFRDAIVTRVPSAQEIENVLQRHPDLRVEVLATEGELLSRKLQDGQSYRYGIISVGRRDLNELAKSSPGAARRCRSSSPKCPGLRGSP